MSLLTLDEVCMGQIVKRPSKHIKSPYVADVLVDDIPVLLYDSYGPQLIV